MPCWTVQTFSVEFQAKHVDLIKTALDALNYQWVYDEKKQTITIDKNNDWSQIIIDLANKTAKLRPELQDRLNKLKQQYSVEAIKLVAKKKHWSLRLTEGQSKGVLSKRN